jgi:hypothetical protein
LILRQFIAFNMIEKFKIDIPREKVSKIKEKVKNYP